MPEFSGAQTVIRSQGNAKTQQRALKRAMGELSPRRRQRNQTLATMPASSYTLPTIQTRTRHDDSQYGYGTRTVVRATAVYPRKRRVIPDHEKPSKVIVTRS